MRRLFLFKPLYFSVALFLGFGMSLDAELVISEIQSANSGTLLDSDGDSSDWIEIYNAGSSDADLAGYYLTDGETNLARWQFPAQPLAVGGFLVVFASGKDRANVGKELHTDFQMSSGGDYVALVRPDGVTIEDDYFPAFSAMADDESFGRPFTSNTLISEGTNAEVFVPSTGALGTEWTQRSFNASSWQDATTGIGYGESSSAKIDGLVAYYNFEEGSGRALIDQSGNGNNGVLRNMSSNDWVTSKSGLGKALDFDGSNDHITLKSANALGLQSNNFTVTSWARLDNVNGDNTIVGQDDAGLHLTTRGDQVYFGFWGNDSNSGSQTVQASRWYHLAWRYTNGEQAIFIDGKQAKAEGGHEALRSSAVVNLGRSKGGQGWFDGQLDEVAIFEESLSNLDIAELATSQTLSGSGLDLEGLMKGRNASAYVRVPFMVSDSSSFDSLVMRLQYNDGFVAYLNGVEVARRNAPASVQWNSSATQSRIASEATVWESINLSEHKNLIVAGSNVLALQGLNASVNDTTFLINPQLSAGGLQEGQPGIFSDATPGAPNAEITSFGKVADTKFSVDRGFYDAPFQVAITSLTEGSQIRYTTDGSEPSTTDGTLYSSPISINKTTTLRAVAFKGGFTASNLDTQTYLFVDDIVSQSSTPPSGWPTNSVNGQELDYGMDSPSAIGSNTTELKEALLALDTISIVTDKDNLFDSSEGIYVNAGRRGRSWERPTSIELIRKDGKNGFQMNAGLRIRGGFSRSNGNPKHALRLFFRSEYGGSLNYPLFGREGTDRFKNIDFRTSQNYSWAFQGSSQNSFIREVFARDTQRDMGSPYTRSRYYHLYLNGIYWGLYMSQERAEASYGESYFGGDSSEYDVVKSAGSSGGYSIEATDGEMAGWTEFWNIANQIAASSSSTTRFNLYQQLQGLTSNGLANPAFPTYLHVDNLIDYMMVILYTGNFDAPISNFLGNERPNNWFSMWNRNGGDGFKFFAHDSEHSLGVRSGAVSNRNGPWPAGSEQRYSNPQWIHQQLMAVEAYRERFADRAHELLLNDGPLSPAAATVRVEARAVVIDKAIIAESARWGDAQRSNPLRRSDWLNQVSKIKDHVASRAEVMVEQFRNTTRFSTGKPTDSKVSAPLYAAVDAPSLNQHGGPVASDFGLQFTSGGGTVYYTLDGTDPRGANGSVSASAESADNASITSQTLYRSSNGVKVLIPNNGSIGSSWRNVSFNDTTWRSGNGGVGYDNNTTYDSLIEVDVDAQMDGVNTSAYVRCNFTADSPSNYQGLTLRLRFEDGFIAYLNGEEVARFNAPGSAVWNSEATGLHDDGAAQDYIDFDLTAHRNKLVAGSNVLAIHGLNDNIGSSDFLIDPLVVAQRVAGGSAVVLADAQTTVSARALQNGQWSALTQAEFLVDAQEASASNFVLSELMYNPTGPSNPEIAAGFLTANDFEYLEVINVSDRLIDLSGVQFLDGITFDFDNADAAVLVPRQRAVLVSNRLAFVMRYGNQAFVIGEYAGLLSNGGEQIIVANGAGDIISNFLYDDAEPWPVAADGLGSSLVLLNTDTVSDSSESDKWRASATGGSPGLGDGEDVPTILVNEVLAHTDWPQTDAIELFNPTGQAVNIGGWLLTDDPLTPEKYIIPGGTSIPAGGYLVFLEDNDANPNNNVGLPASFFGNAFSLSSIGDEAFLYSADSSGLTGYRHGFSFDGSENGVSFGRFQNSADEEGFPSLERPTLGSANAAPRVPRIAISELMYHPQALDGAEWVEIWNQTDQTIDLFDPDRPTNTWRLRGFDFNFPRGTSLGAGELAVVVGGDPEAFRLANGLGTAAKIFGPVIGSLANGGERVRLLRPDEPTLRDGVAVVPYIVEDSVTFADFEPWPTEPDGEGPSLERMGGDGYSSEPSQWVSSAATGGSPGTIPGRLFVSVNTQGQGTVLQSPAGEVTAGESVTFTPQPAPGWEFVSWAGGASGSSVPLVLTATDSISIVATFRQRWALQMESSEGGQVQASPIAADYGQGSAVTLKAVPAVGFRFIRWEGSASGQANPTTVTMDSNKSVSAVFVAQVGVQASAQGMGAVTIDPNKPLYDVGESVTLTATPSDDAVFSGWQGGLSGVQNPQTVVLAQDLTVSAVFTTLLPVAVSIQGQGQVTRNPDLADYAVGAEVELLAVPQPGWGFIEWLGAVTGSINPATLEVGEALGVTVVFDQFFRLSMFAETGGTVSTSAQAGLLRRGSTTQVTASAAAGFRFLGWSGNTSGSQNPLSITMDANKSVTARFVALGELATSITGSGTITRDPDKPSYDEGEAVTLRAVPTPGWAFASWQGALEGAGNPATLTIEGSQSVTASFKQLFPLELLDSANGTITALPAQGSYLDGTEVTLLATPSPDYEFVRWEGDGPGSTNPLELTMDSAKGVSAVFEKTVPENAFIAWQESQFDQTERADVSISGNAADPDGDGWPNLLEYVFGGDPKRKDARETLQISHQRLDGERILVLQSDIVGDPSTVPVRLEVSRDMQEWHREPVQGVFTFAEVQEREALPRGGERVSWILGSEREPINDTMIYCRLVAELP